MFTDSVKFTPCYYSNRLLTKLTSLNESVSQQVDIDEIKKAISYAQIFHGNQKRESGEPFYSHPLEVAYMTCDYLFTTQAMVTSILHDTIEDTDLTAEMITLAFGNKIAEQVEDLTRNKIFGKISSAELVQSLWQQQKYEVLLIKQFDRLHNMQTISSKAPEKIRKIVNETATTFLHLSAYLESPIVEEELFQLCGRYLKADKELNSLTGHEFCY